MADGQHGRVEAAEDQLHVAAFQLHDVVEGDHLGADLHGEVRIEQVQAVQHGTFRAGVGPVDDFQQRLDAAHHLGRLLRDGRAAAQFEGVGHNPDGLGRAGAHGRDAQGDVGPQRAGQPGHHGRGLARAQVRQDQGDGLRQFAVDQGQDLDRFNVFEELEGLAGHVDREPVEQPGGLFRAEGCLQQALGQLAAATGLPRAGHRGFVEVLHDLLGDFRIHLPQADDLRGDVLGLGVVELGHHLGGVGRAHLHEDDGGPLGSGEGRIGEFHTGCLSSMRPRR